MSGGNWKDMYSAADTGDLDVVAQTWSDSYPFFKGICQVRFELASSFF